MTAALTDVDSFDTCLTIVDNVDPANAATITALLQPVANRTRNAKNRLDALVNDMADKADAAATTAALAAKADAAATTTALAAKADASALTSGLAAKADSSAMTTALAAKADASALTSGLATKADAAATTTALAAKADSSTTVSAGAGCTGGGDLSANRTINVAAHADGSIVVNADDVQVGVLATDAQHGTRGGGTLHADVVAGGASGFMTGAQATKLSGIATSAAAVTASTPANVTKAAAAVGVATDAARADHKHDVTTAAPVAVGAANAEGSSSSLARADHVHDASSKADVLLTLNDQVGTTYTFQLSDVGKLVTLANAANITATIPANASVAMPVGAQIFTLQKGAGQVTYAITTDTLNQPGLTYKSRAQWAFVTLTKISSTVWVASGDLAVV